MRATLPSKEAQIRKQQNTLVTSAKAIVVFSVWAMIRMVMLFFLNSELIDRFIDVDVSRGAVLILILILSAFGLLIRIYIARCARREANGDPRQRVFYLVLATILLILAVLSIISMFRADPDDSTFAMRMAGLVVDITSAVAVLEMILAVIRIRHLRALPDASRPDTTA